MHGCIVAILIATKDVWNMLFYNYSTCSKDGYIRWTRKKPITFNKCHCNGDILVKRDSHCLVKDICKILQGH